MSIISRLFPKSLAITPTPTVEKSEPQFENKGWSTTNPSPGLLLGGFNQSHTGSSVNQYSALASAAVYCAVRTLSEDTASLPILVQKKLASGGFVVTENHPLVDIFENPNEWITGFELVSHIVTSLCLRGNAYVYIDRAGDGSPRRLIPVAPDSTQVNLAPTSGIITYSMNHPLLGGSIMAPAENVLHIKNIVVGAGVLGISPISASQDVFSLAIQTQVHAAKIFAQGTTVSGVLEVPKVLSEESARRMSQSWSDAYSSTTNAHKTPVLEDGVRFTPFNISPKDQQLLEARNFTVEEIARMFNLPPHKLGAMSRVSYSSLESQQQAYVDSSLTPICTKIEKAFERKLLFSDERKRYKIKFDFMNLLKGDTKARFDAYSTALLNGIYNVDEVRAREGLPPLPDGKGAEHRFPLNQAAGVTPTINTPDEPATPEATNPADIDALESDNE